LSRGTFSGRRRDRPSTGFASRSAKSKVKNARISSSHTMTQKMLSTKNDADAEDCGSSDACLHFHSNLHIATVQDEILPYERGAKDGLLVAGAAEECPRRLLTWRPVCSPSIVLFE